MEQSTIKKITLAGLALLACGSAVIAYRKFSFKKVIVESPLDDLSDYEKQLFTDTDTDTDSGDTTINEVDYNLLHKRSVEDYQGTDFLPLAEDMPEEDEFDPMLEEEQQQSDNPLPDQPPIIKSKKTTDSNEVEQAEKLKRLESQFDADIWND
jgi:hypothetical protein